MFSSIRGCSAASFSPDGDDGLQQLFRFGEHDAHVVDQLFRVTV